MNNSQYCQQKSDDIIVQKDKDLIYLFNAQNGTKINLTNTTAIFIWQSLKTPKNLNQLAKLMEQKFQITDKNQVLKDIKLLIEKLNKLGFVKKIKA